MPFLDHKLIEFAFSLPVSFKLRNGRGKYILRRALEERLPSAFQVKKRPFVAGSSETLGLDRTPTFLRDIWIAAPFVKPACSTPRSWEGCAGVFPTFPVAPGS